MCNSTEITPLFFEAACDRFRQTKNVSKISFDCGFTNSTVLRNKLNPSQHHQLTVRELINITHETQDGTLVNGALLELGMQAIKLPKTDDTNCKKNYLPENLLDPCIEINIQAGNLLHDAQNIKSMSRITRTHRDEIKDRALALTREALFFMSELDRRFHAGSFIAIATDMATSGAGAIAGL